MHRHDAARRARNDVTLPSPSTPEAVTAEEGFERGAVALEWSPAQGAETYEVWRGTTATPEEMVLLASGIAGETRFIDRTAEFDQPYYYRVRARNIAGESAFSEPAEGKQSTRRWVRALASVPVNSPALGNDGLLRVLIAAYGEPPTNRMVALDADGEIQWQVETGPVLAGPVLGADNTAYCVTSEELIAFDATGTRKWTSPLPEPPFVPTFPGSPVYRSDMLALTGDGDLVLGAHPERVYWYSPAGELIRTAYTTAASAQAVVVTDDGGICLSGGTPNVLSMFERNGYSRWRVYPPNAGYLAGGPDGSIIVAGAGQVNSMDASGALIFAAGYGPQNAQTCAPVVGPDGTIYIVRLKSQLIALAADGTPLWSVPALSINSSPALLADGTLLVYAGSRLSTYASNGTALSEVSLLGWNYFDNGSPVVAPDGTIFAVGGTNIICLAGTVPLASGGWPSSRHDVRQTGCQAGPAPAPQPLVDAKASEGTSVNQIRVSWAPNPDMASVEVWRSVGSNLETAVLVAVVEPGVFEYFDQGIHPGEISHYWLRARNDAGTTPFTEALRGYGATEAWVRWKYDGSSNLSAPALGSSNQVHVINEEGVLVTLNEFGTPAWSFGELSPPLHGPAVGLDGTVFVNNTDELAAVRPDGTLKWRHPLTAGAAAPMTVGWDGTIYLVQGNQLTAIDPEGIERWRILVEVLRPPYLALGLDDRLRVGTQYGTAKLQANGEVAQQVAGASGPMALAPDGALFIASPAYKLSAFEPTGAVRFNFVRLPRRPVADSEPVLGVDQRAYVSRNVGPLNDWTCAVDAQGQLLWEYPALANGLVADDTGGLIITMADHVTAFRSDGTSRWDYQIDDVTPTPPFLTKDGALCFSAANKLIMLHTELRPAESGWPMWRADAQRSGRTWAACRVVTCRKCDTGELELKFAGTANLTYFVERSSDLVEWSVVAEGVATPGVTTIRLPPVEGENLGFYRVRQ
jgi:hypothetical protein